MNEAEQIKHYGMTEQQISDNAEGSLHVMMNDDLAGYISLILENTLSPYLSADQTRTVRQAQYLLSVITYNNENGE